MLQDIAELRSMQLRISGHGGEAGVPDGVEHIEVIDRVLRRDRHPVARLQSKLLTQGGGEPRGAARKLAIVAHHPVAQTDGGVRAVTSGRTPEPKWKIQSPIPLSDG